jgi:ATP synthase F0 subunit c
MKSLLQPESIYKLTLKKEKIQMTGDIVAAFQFLGAGLAMLGAIGAGVGVGLAAMGGVQAMGRNPDAAPIIQTNMILGMAFAEAVAIYALAVALIIIFAA